MKKAKIGLVTVLYNSENVIIDFIESVQKQDCRNFHLYLVDNSVSKEACNLYKKHLSDTLIEYTYIENTTNVGVAEGNNIGIRRAMLDGVEFVLLLNNDIFIEKDTLFSNLLHLASLYKDTIIIPKIMIYGTNRIWMAGGCFKMLSCTTKHFGGNEEDSGMFDKQRFVEYAPTCFMLIPVNIFNRVGFMDSKYFVYYDDTDFIYRIYKKKIKILYAPNLVIYHKVSVSTGGESSLFTIYYANRNRIYFVRKNLIIIHPVYIYLFFAFCMKYIKYNKEQRQALCKAFKDGFSL